MSQKDELMKPEENGVPYENQDQAFAAVKDANIDIYQILYKHRVNLRRNPNPRLWMIELTAEYRIQNRVTEYRSSYTDMLSYFPHDYKEPTIYDLMSSDPTNRPHEVAKRHLDEGLSLIQDILTNYGLYIQGDEGHFNICAEFVDDNDGTRRIHEVSSARFPGRKPDYA